MTAEVQTIPDKKGPGWPIIVLIVVCIAVLTSALTVWLAKMYLFPTNFKPVQLSTQEEQVLDDKLKTLTSSQAPVRGQQNSEGTLTPEPYSETNANRHIHLTERELNGLLARNTQLADKLAIDLSDDLASAKLLIPLDPEFPVFGGKTLKVTAGLELRYAGDKPVVILRGVSIWGVPMPNAWLGGLKNINLVDEFGVDSGFWRTFSDGVDHIRIDDGRLTLKLKP